MAFNDRAHPTIVLTTSRLFHCQQPTVNKRGEVVAMGVRAAHAILAGRIALRVIHELRKLNIDAVWQGECIASSDAAHRFISSDGMIILRLLRTNIGKIGAREGSFVRHGPKHQESRRNCQPRTKGLLIVCLLRCRCGVKVIRKPLDNWAISDGASE